MEHGSLGPESWDTDVTSHIIVEGVFAVRPRKCLERARDSCKLLNCSLPDVSEHVFRILKAF